MNGKWIAGLVLLLVAGAAPGALAQNKVSIAERLGFVRDAKLLIVHADDVGMTHAVNAATIKALESGGVNSASIMVACPWFPEIAEYAKAHPEADFGLHLTLTSERVYYRWGPVAPRDRVASLVDENGYFWHDWTAATRIEPKEVELELRAQIERAYAMGIRPTHRIRTSTGCTTTARNYSRCCCGSRTRENCGFLWCATGLRSTRIWSPA